MTSDASPLDQPIQWSLSQWLTFLEKQHSKEIDLGLARTQQVLANLHLDFSAKTLITVAGTNGKGTTCAFLEQSALALNKQVGVYSSPHIHDYRERVRINGQMLSESAHCQAFYRVELARNGTPLTYFEYSTLAALLLLAESECEWLLLEVGLGGRLDAINVVDPDIAVITSIDLDHQAWLGDTREAIGREKAGIFRPKGKVVIGDPQPPESVTDVARQLSCDALNQGVDFSYVQQQDNWCWQGPSQALGPLSLPQVPMQNVSTGLAVLSMLDVQLSLEQANHIINNTALPGRFETVAQRPRVILDVAHNPQACNYLADKLNQLDYRQLHVVCGFLQDKDIAASLAPLQGMSANWYLCPLQTQRSATLAPIKAVLVGQQKVLDCDSVEQALAKALQDACDDDLVLVMGSFYTVAEAKIALSQKE